MMPDFEPGELVMISVNDPVATVLYRRKERCSGCGGPVWHLCLIDTGEHVDYCEAALRRRSN